MFKFFATMTNGKRALIAGSLLTLGALLLAFALGVLGAAPVAAIYAVIAFAISAFLFATIGNWNAEWGARASATACIFGVVFSIAAFGIVLFHGVNEAQREADLKVVDDATRAEVSENDVGAARKRLLGGDNAEVTLKTATDIARADKALALATEINNSETMDENAKKVQEAIDARNLADAEAAAKGWTGMVKDYFATKGREYQHLGWRSSHADTVTKVIYWFPTLVFVGVAGLMTLYAAAQFGIKGVIKEPPVGAHWLHWVKFYTDKVLFAPSTKVALGAFALLWFPLWWADMLLEPYDPTPPHSEQDERHETSAEKARAAREKIAERRQTTRSNKDAGQRKQANAHDKKIEGSVESATIPAGRYAFGRDEDGNAHTLVVADN